MMIMRHFAFVGFCVLSLVTVTPAAITNCNTNASAPRCELKSTCCHVLFLSQRDIFGQPVNAFDFLDSCAFTEKQLDAQLRIAPFAFDEVNERNNSVRVKRVTEFAAISRWNTTLDTRRFSLAIRSHSLKDLCQVPDALLCFDLLIVNELYDNQTLVTTTTVSEWDWANSSTRFLATIDLSAASLFAGKLTNVVQTSTSVINVQTTISAFELRLWGDGQWTLSFDSRAGSATIAFSSPQRQQITWSVAVRSIPLSQAPGFANTSSDRVPPTLLIAGQPIDQELVIIAASVSGVVLALCIIVAIIVAVKIRKQRTSHH
jgi:hypothetical protein